MKKCRYNLVVHFALMFLNVHCSCQKINKSHITTSEITKSKLVTKIYRDVVWLLQTSDVGAKFFISKLHAPSVLVLQYQ